MRIGILFAQQYIDELVDSGQSFFVLSDSHIFSLWKHIFPSKISPILIPPGEFYKNWSSIDFISKFLVQNGGDRQSHLLIFGGGGLCDLGGFVASCYMRGISFSFVPTTLLAMVDASIGGKTAINTCFGKNLLGTFAWPTRVTIDPVFLQTLSAEQLSQGLAEMIKHALLAGEVALISLEEFTKNLPTENLPQHWLPYIEQSCRIKMSWIDGDETETRDKRIFLNLGHTLAHALEAATQYQIVSHGEAVMWGLLFAAYLSTEFCGLPQNSWLRIESILKPHLCPWPQLQINVLCSFFIADKKSVRKQLRWILLKQIGQPQMQIIDLQQIQTCLAAFIAKFT